VAVERGAQDKTVFGSMKAVFVGAAVLASIGVANAECANQCSGHGSCGVDDICTCYPMWTEGDCSARKCPSRPAWGDIADTSVTGRQTHFYAECANRGRCDGETGECVCDAGFEGEGCERMSCPNNCNGHGSCELMSSANSGYAGWDANMIQFCKCDPGYEGHDCLDRKCKLGDDPISRFSSADVSEVPHEQTIDLAFTGATGSFLLEYTDWRGNAWLTRPIFPQDVIDIVPVENRPIPIREALLTLPMRAIDDIIVTVATAIATSIKFTVGFSSSETPGTQPLLSVLHKGCTAAGCQPKYEGLSGGSATVEGVSTTGTGQRDVCSNRGKCNSEIGECECFSGFYGHACEKQTLVL